MKWLGYSALALGLLVACEKDLPFERTKAPVVTPVVPMPGLSFDAGRASMDAQVVGRAGCPGAHCVAQHRRALVELAVTSE